MLIVNIEKINVSKCLFMVVNVLFVLIQCVIKIMVIVIIDKRKIGVILKFVKVIILNNVVMVIGVCF